MTDASIAAADSVPARARDGLSARIALFGWSLSVVALWMLQHPYSGLHHDSRVYALLALARLHPATLGGDVFLRFGSQDRFTAFSPIFATAIRLFDLGPAAALLTFLSQVAFFGCALALARRLMPAREALLAVALLIVLPAYYGSAHIFSYAEDFLTPRLPAAALVLGAIAAALSHRHVIAGLCISVAFVLHPIVGSAGIALLFMMLVSLPRPTIAVIFGATALLVTTAGALVAPAGPFVSFDPTWLKLVDLRNPYLFVSEWTAEDWRQTAIPAAMLLMGLIVSERTVIRNTCKAALLTAVCSLALTFLWCDTLHIVLLTQMQPWRWIWLAAALAVLLSPVIAADCWHSAAGRAALMLLAAACFFGGQEIQPVIVLLALLCAGCTRLAGNSRYGAHLTWGAAALLIGALALKLADPSSYFTVAGKADDPAVILGATAAHDTAKDGLIPAVLAVLVWWLVRLSESNRTAALAVTAVAITACACLGPYTWGTWTSSDYDRARQARYDRWREQIPPQAEVLWPDTALGAWYLIDRRSYWSPHQLVGDIFSRDKALEMARRTALVDSAVLASDPKASARLTPGKRAGWYPGTVENLDSRGLALLCADPDLGYVVSNTRPEPSPFEPVTANPGKPGRLYLFRCADLRG